MKKTFLTRYMLYVKGVKKNFLINLIFTPVSWLIGAVTSSINFLYRHGLLKIEEPPLPLISVGNLTYGGTNKTGAQGDIKEGFQAHGRE